MDFNEFRFSENLMDALDAMHFKECTPIQELAIPHLLDGKDLIEDSCLSVPYN